MKKHVGISGRVVFASEEGFSRKTGAEVRVRPVCEASESLEIAQFSSRGPICETGIGFQEGTISEKVCSPPNSRHSHCFLHDSQ